jgi:pyrroloquinoline-quinone synthase
MNPQQFQNALDERVGRYDLLAHPFYQAWSTGKLSREQLRAYAREYFHHIAAFPTFLSALHCRLADGALRRAVLRNLAEEEVEGRAHSDMWLDFAQGLGLSSERVQHNRPGKPICRLIQRFHNSACQDSPIEVLAAFYAYESQIPRLSGERARALMTYYGADAHTCGYFVLHTYSDVRHSQVWFDQMFRLIADNERLAEPALNSAGRTADWLWQALDGSAAHRLDEESFQRRDGVSSSLRRRVTAAS